MTREQFRDYADSVKSAGGLHLTDLNYKTKAQYDSALTSGVKSIIGLKENLLTEK